jgi:peptidoglycan/LPS O-acetylase OafA/YrhL
VALLLGILTSFLQRDLLSSLPWADDGYFYTLKWISKCEERQPLQHIGLHVLLLNGIVPSTWLPNAGSTFLAPAWSLSLEWQFYLVAPVLWRWRRSPLTWGILLGAFLASKPYESVFTNPQKAFLPSSLPAFCIGIASAAIWMIDDAKAKGRRWMFTLGAVLLAGMLVILRWNPITLLAWIWAFGSVAQWWDFLPPARWCRQLFQSPILQWLGTVSYPLYLLH